MICSDDRSAEVFQKRIDTATQMKSVLGSNEKPNCLIIDEIDGAPTVRSGSLKQALSFLFMVCYKCLFFVHLWYVTGCYQHPASSSAQERRTRRGCWCRDREEEKEEGDHPAPTNHLHL